MPGALASISSPGLAAMIAGVAAFDAAPGGDNARIFAATQLPSLGSNVIAAPQRAPGLIRSPCIWSIAS